MSEAELECCEGVEIHQDRLKIVSDQMPEEATAPGAGYKDGSYTGTGEGFNGQVTVTINVSGGNIVSAGYDGEDDEPEFSNAWNGIYNQIMGKQSADGIDTVTDATYSSNGLIQAFQSAISQAK